MAPDTLHPRPLQNQGPELENAIIVVLSHPPLLLKSQMRCPPCGITPPCIPTFHASCDSPNNHAILGNSYRNGAWSRADGRVRGGSLTTNGDARKFRVSAYNPPVLSPPVIAAATSSFFVPVD